MSFKKFRRGMTLVEVTVSLALVTVLLVGLSAIFLSTNRIYGQGTDKANAKEFAQNAVLAVEGKLRSCREATLKNVNFEGDNIIFSDGSMILTAGGKKTTIGGKADRYRLDAVFERAGDTVVKLTVSAFSLSGNKLYEVDRTITLENVALAGRKVIVQDSNLTGFSGVEFGG